METNTFSLFPAYTVIDREMNIVSNKVRDFSTSELEPLF